MSAVEKNRDASPAPMATPDEDHEVAAKTYHNRYPGSTVVTKTGETIEFPMRTNGDLTTTSSALQAELNKVANKSGSPIYTTEKPVIPMAETAPVEAIKERAAEIVAQLKAEQAKATGG